MSNSMDFKQKMSGLLSQLFTKIFKQGLDMKGIDQLHQVSNRMGLIIVEAASKAALIKCKLLNDATAKGFKLMGEELDELKARVKKLEDR